MRSLLSFTIVMTLIGIPIPSQGNERPSNQDYWTQTGLSYRDVYTWFTDERCLKSFREFYGCIEGLNALLNSLPTQPLGPSIDLSEIRLIPTDSKSLTENQHLILRVLHSFGNIQLVQSVAAPLPRVLSNSLAELKRTIQSDRNQTQNEWRQTYLKRLSFGIQFFPIVFHLHQMASVHPEKIATAVGSALNTYLAITEDPHTYFIPRQKKLDEIKNGSDQSYSGIGVTLEQINGLTLIRSVNDAGPAFAAGIQKNDIIERVDGRSLQGLTMDVIVAELFRGKEGSPIQLDIRRSEKRIPIALKRAKISVKNVETAFHDLGMVKIGKIRLRSFTPRSSCDDVRAAILEMHSRLATHLVLDLRDNGGGSVEQATCIAGLFLGPHLLVVNQIHLESGDSVPLMTSETKLTDLRLLILTNSSSASASEIIAGSLQDYGRALILGTRTYGKATVQEPSVAEFNSELTFYKTTYRFHRPSGLTSQIYGIHPDIEIFNQATPSDEERFAFREEDLYQLVPTVGPPWRQPRPDRINTIHTCMKTLEPISSRLHGVMRDDYTLQRSALVAHCY